MPASLAAWKRSILVQHRAGLMSPLDARKHLRIGESRYARLVRAGRIRLYESPAEVNDGRRPIQWVPVADVAAMMLAKRGRTMGADHFLTYHQRAEKALGRRLETPGILKRAIALRDKRAAQAKADADAAQAPKTHGPLAPLPLKRALTGRGRAPLDATFADWMLTLHLEGKAANTRAAYRRDLDALRAFLRGHSVTDLAECTADLLSLHVQSLTRDGRLKSASVARHIATVRALWRWAHASRLVPQDTAALLDSVKKGRRLPRTMSPAESASLVESPRGAITTTPQPTFRALAVRDCAILETMYASGLRASEVAGLRPCDVNRTDRTLYILHGKGDKSRIVPTHNAAIAAIDAYLADARPLLVSINRKGDPGRLFLSHKGRALERVALWQIVRRRAETVGLAHKAHPHMLRHSCATDLMAGGADLLVIAAMLGHSSILTSEIYTHVDRTKLAAVIRKHHPRP